MPLFQDGRDLIVILFGHKIVRSRLHVFQDTVEFSSFLVLRMQMKFGRWKGMLIHYRRSERRKVQIGRKKCERRCALAKLEEELASTEVDRRMILAVFAQCNAPWIWPSRSSKRNTRGQSGSRFRPRAAWHPRSRFHAST